MPRFEQIRDRLPTLYRPEEGDTSLLTRYIRAVADMLETLNREAGDVLQAHWFAYADRALHSPFFLRGLELEGRPFPRPNDPSLLGFPHVRDLGRLASLLSLPPWQEPPSQRELVEAYRIRIGRTVALYRNGLGTLDALRRMVESQLPMDLDASEEARDRGFWLEEFPPAVARSLAAKARGEPLDMVGPLMRWQISHDGMVPAPPTLFIQGVEPQEGFVDATKRPVIELYSHGDQKPRLGIAHAQTIAPGKTLRLRPAYASWIGLDTGIAVAESLPAETLSGDPTAPGPWQALEAGPGSTVAAIRQTLDKVLWVAVNGEGSASLWCTDGKSWTQVLDALPHVACLAERGHELLLGTQAGLFGMGMYPEQGASRQGMPIAALSGQAVHALFQGGDATLWIGTSRGAFTMDAGGEVAPSDLQEVEVFGIHRDGSGTLYFGTDLGLFQYQPGPRHWYFYSGLAHVEQTPDWRPFSPGSLPSGEQVGLPPVRCVLRGTDASLWVGTDHGIARYLARSVGGLTYETVLEAFPDLTVGPVHHMALDARGLVWFCTDRGIFRYDGRDMWQFQGSAWIRLGRADTVYTSPAGPRGTWRFDRPSASWQRLNTRTFIWEDFTDLPRSSSEARVHTVCWTDLAVGDLGHWDGTTFTPSEEVDGTDLGMRFKPGEERIVDGGIPAVPRLPVGSSTWRYLSWESEETGAPADRPAWTMEGRLLPPPAHQAAAAPGRWNLESPPPSSNFDEAVFAFRPSARVWFQWESCSPLTITVRLKTRSPGEHIDPAILDRVWQGVQQARPAGTRAMLGVEEQIVRGKQNG